MRSPILDHALGGIIAFALFFSIAPRASAMPIGNLIVNSDFSSGNSGFTTDYVYSPGDLVPIQSYDIVTDPSLSHPEAFSFGDHTSGSGLMMALNGATSTAPVAWSQSVSVVANSSYDFSLWVASWFPTNPAQLRVLINSVPIAPDFSAPSSPGVWSNLSASWNSGSSTVAAISITDQQTIFSGDDFALDDISFVGLQVPEPSIALLLVTSLCAMAWVTRRLR